MAVFAGDCATAILADTTYPPSVQGCYVNNKLKTKGSESLQAQISAWRTDLQICWRRGRESNPSRRLCRPFRRL